MNHESTLTDRIWNLVQGMQDPELEQHIHGCEQCKAELTALRSLAQLRETAGGDFAHVSDDQRRRLSGLIGRYRNVRPAADEASPSVLSKLQVIVAELLHDTGGQLQVAGLRSGSSAGSRQVAFVSDVADLDLEITPKTSCFSVIGQVGMDSVPNDLSVAFVPANHDPLETDSDVVISAPVDAQGYFQIEVAGGEWTVSLTVDDAVILFPGVTL